MQARRCGRALCVLTPQGKTMAEASCANFSEAVVVTSVELLHCGDLMPALDRRCLLACWWAAALLASQTRRSIHSPVAPKIAVLTPYLGSVSFWFT